MHIAGSRALLGRSRRDSVAKSVGLLAPPSDGLITTGAAPTFSVIVAAYNVADLITEALASIREQSVAPFGGIVCGDASTDGLEGALKPYREEIVFLRKENGGEASAKNAAARAAKGELVLLPGADGADPPPP